MTDRMDISLERVPDRHLEHALSLARTFDNRYPRRVGRQERVLYRIEDEYGDWTFEVYRTGKRRLIVRAHLAS